MSLLTKAIFTKFGSLVDKSIKIELVTLEFDAEMIQGIGELLGENVNIYITKGLISPETTAILDDTAVEGMPIKTKTCSQRLRQAIWRLWEQEGAKGSDEEHYNLKMEEIIDHVKSKLE